MASTPGPGRARHWWAAARPKTLPAGVAPVVVGTAFAYADHGFEPLVALAALLGAVFIQVGTNLANDYHDHRRGADAPDRAGPARASAMGWIPPRHVLAGALTSFLMAAGAGLYLVWVAGWPIVLIGLASIASGYLYTGGPYPLGYHGWGDLFVLVFFGPIAVGGTYFVQTLRIPTMPVILAGIALGSIATAILVVNNVRDFATDARVGKRTLAVKFGARFGRAEYVVLLGVAFVVPLALLMLMGPWLLLPLIAVPVVPFMVRSMFGAVPERLNALLADTARLMAVYALLLSIGVVAM